MEVFSIPVEGTQYTSKLYRNAIKKYRIQQSMNSAGGRCHDNVRCESMWARVKEELLYSRYDLEIIGQNLLTYPLLRMKALLKSTSHILILHLKKVQINVTMG